MSIFFAAVLMVGQLVAAVALAIGIPLLVGYMVWDMVSSSRSGAGARQSAVSEPIDEEAAASRIFLERSIARAFVIMGGSFWGVAVFAGIYSFQRAGIRSALLGAMIPFAATLVALIVGWYFERTASVLLAAATAAVVYWGVTHSFEPGVWIIMTVAFIGPMLTAAVLFWLARGEQEAMEFRLASKPALAPVPARSGE